MAEFPIYYDLCPCVDLYYSPAYSMLVLCVRRWTANGKVFTEDGAYLWDRADRVLALPIAAAPLGKVIPTMLSASRQIGKHVPTLARPGREVVNMLDRDTFDAAFYSLVVWTHRDTTTPYVIGAALSSQVNCASVLVPKDAPEEVLGSAILTFLEHIRKLYWSRERPQ